MKYEKKTECDIQIPSSGDYNITFNRGSYGYEEVMKTFDSCEEIYILTYSIGEELLNRLYKLNGNKKIVIVTNDPYVKLEKSGDITFTNVNNHDFIERIVSSQKFAVQTATYFNYSNHSKIVMTDKLAYIGSQNFYGATSFETGVIVKEQRFIEKIKSEIVDVIIDHSRPYSINRNLYQLHNIINLYKKIEYLFEEPLQEASNDNYENNAYRNFIVIDKSDIKKVYEIIIEIYNLMMPTKYANDLKKLLTQSINELNNSFIHYNEFKRCFDIVREGKKARYGDLVNAALNCLTSSKLENFGLIIDNIENAIESLNEISYKVEEFIMDNLRFYENEES